MPNEHSFFSGNTPQAQFTKLCMDLDFLDQHFWAYCFWRVGKDDKQNKRVSLPASIFMILLSAFGLYVDYGAGILTPEEQLLAGYLLTWTAGPVGIFGLVFLIITIIQLIGSRELLGLFQQDFGSPEKANGIILTPDALQHAYEAMSPAAKALVGDFSYHRRGVQAWFEQARANYEKIHKMAAALNRVPVERLQPLEYFDVEAICRVIGAANEGNPDYQSVADDIEKLVNSYQLNLRGLAPTMLPETRLLIEGDGVTGAAAPGAAASAAAAPTTMPSERTPLMSQRGGDEDVSGLAQEQAEPARGAYQP